MLKSLGGYLKKYFRASDMVFRIGGEEFLALIYNADEPGRLNIAEKLRREIEQLSLISDRKVTVSIGVSNLHSDKSWEDATAKAVKKASKSVKNIRSAWVKDQSVTVKDGEVAGFRVAVKISFEVEYG